MRLARYALPLLLLVQAPAFADPHVVVNGLACAMATVSSAPGVQTGVLTGGPLLVTADGQPADAVLHCWVQIGSDEYNAGTMVAEAFATGTGVLELVEPITAMIPVGSRVYVCSELAVAGASQTVRVDSDLSRSGDQCQPGDPTGPGYVPPPTGWHCVWAHAGVPPVYEVNACVPVLDGP